MSKVVIIVIVIVIGILVGGLLLLRNNTQTSPKSLISDGVQLALQASPTPIPFQELTIPYLRDRKYESSLGPLEKISENSSYESFLTSYISDGLKINGQLTKPKDEMPPGGRPAVVFIHGYIPPSRYQTLSRYINHVDFLARNGLVVFKIDLRGHGDSEGDPGGGYYSSDYIVDALNARAALQSADFVNKDKIGFWGHSMGGNVVFRAFTAAEDIKAVVIWAGAVYTYSDFNEYRISDNNYQPPPSDSPARRKRNELFETYGQFDPESEFWKQVPATNFLDGLTGAVEVHHAVDDEVVEIGYSRNLMEILEGTRLTHKLWEYPSGGHNLTGISFNTAMQRTVDFFKENL